MKILKKEFHGNGNLKLLIFKEGGETLLRYWTEQNEECKTKLVEVACEEDPNNLTINLMNRWEIVFPNGVITRLTYLHRNSTTSQVVVSQPPVQISFNIPSIRF